MSGKQYLAPDSTAARVALWRALHVEFDPPPHVLEDEVGLKLLAPDKDWCRRADMGPAVHATIPGLHRGPCPLHRGLGHGTR